MSRHTLNPDAEFYAAIRQRDDARDAYAAILSYYPPDVEQCDACGQVEGVCPFHAGVEAGISLLRRAVDVLAKES
ncbi:MAG: hypothetical protein ACRDMV_18245 [Streptosporangiales bacterium]